MRPGQDDIEMACSSVIYKRAVYSRAPRTVHSPSIEIFFSSFVLFRLTIYCMARSLTRSLARHSWINIKCFVPRVELIVTKLCVARCFACVMRVCVTNASSLTNRNANLKCCCYTIRSMTIIFTLIKRYANLNERPIKFWNTMRWRRLDFGFH